MRRGRSTDIRDDSCVFSERIDRQQYCQIRYRKIVGATARAVQIVFVNEPIWCALSTVEFENEPEPPHTIFVKKWLAEKLRLNRYKNYKSESGR